MSLPLRLRLAYHATDGESAGWVWHQEPYMVVFTSHLEPRGEGWSATTIGPETFELFHRRGLRRTGYSTRREAVMAVYGVLLAEGLAE